MEGSKLFFNSSLKPTKRVDSMKTPCSFKSLIKILLSPNLDTGNKIKPFITCFLLGKETYISTYVACSAATDWSFRIQVYEGALCVYILIILCFGVLYATSLKYGIPKNENGLCLSDFFLFYLAFRISISTHKIFLFRFTLRRTSNCWAGSLTWTDRPYSNK